MATSGYQGIDILVNVKMQSIIHDTYTVHFDTPWDTTLSPSSMTFTPANWNTNQVLTAKCNTPGPCDIPVTISAPYRLGELKHSIIALDIMPYPTDVWIGSTPYVYDGSSGDLFIAHKNLVIGQIARFGIPTFSGWGRDVPAPGHSNMTVVIDKPGGGSDFIVASPGGGNSYTMMQLGNYRFRIVFNFAVIQGYNAGAGNFIQIADITFAVSDVSGSPTLVGPITKGGVQPQGYSVLSGGQQGFSDTILGGPPYVNGPVTDLLPLPIGGYVEQTFVGSLSFRDTGTTFTETNCTGTSASAGGTTITLTSALTNAPFTHSGSAGSKFQVQLDGVDVGYIQACGFVRP